MKRLAWIDADKWLAICERTRGPLLPGWDRPLSWDGARHLAQVTGGFEYEYQSDGTTLIHVADEAAFVDLGIKRL